MQVRFSVILAPGAYQQARHFTKICELHAAGADSEPQTGSEKDGNQYVGPEKIVDSVNHKAWK